MNQAARRVPLRTPRTGSSDATAPRAGSIRLPNGVALRYVEQGLVTGVPVLLLHGYTDSWRSFERVLPHLPASMHAIAVSQRGHGDSDRPAEGYGPSEFAADLAAFMDALSLGPAVVVGHCMGAAIAQRFAIDHPSRTRGLVLIGAFATLHGNDVAMELVEAVAALVDPIDANFVRAFQQGTLARPVPPAFLDAVVQESLKVPARIWRAALDPLVSADLAPALGAIQARTLIAWGDQDQLVSRCEQDALATAIANARLAVYPGTGHGLHWEEPERFAADLTAFTEALPG